LFIESDARQAPEIASRSGKPVLCIETQSMFYPSTEEQVLAKVRRLPWSLPLRIRRKFFRGAGKALRLPNY
jgi:hypothetical protein